LEDRGGDGLGESRTGRPALESRFVALIQSLAIYRARRGSVRSLRALFAGIQKVEIASGETLLLPQTLGHSGAHERPGRDPSEHVVVPREHLAQLRADVRLRELRRDLLKSTDAFRSRL
jgi:hypothetical protein